MHKASKQVNSQCVAARFPNTVQTRLLGLVLAALFMLASSLFTAPAFAQPDNGDAAETERLFNEAMAALNADDLRTARNRFQNLVDSKPNLHRARLELARVHYLSYNYESARAETQTVLDDPNTPPDVRVTLLAFLAQLDKDEQVLADRHRWGGSIYLGTIFDSNVNVGPDRDTIEFGGAQVPLTAASRETSDMGANISGGITHNYSPGVTFELAEHSGFFVWQSQLYGTFRQYFDEDDFSLGVLTLRTGPAWIVPRHWQAGIGLQFDQIWLGGDNLALFSTLNPNITWQFGELWDLTASITVTDRAYKEASNRPREGLYTAAAISASHLLIESGVRLQAGIGYSSFDAEEDEFSQTGPDAFLGFSASPWRNGTVYARVSWRQYDFDGQQPGFGFARDDDELRYSLGFQHDFQSGFLQNWQLLGSVGSTDNSSNVPIFDYGREQYNLGLSRNF